MVITSVDITHNIIIQREQFPLVSEDEYHPALTIHMNSYQKLNSSKVKDSDQNYNFRKCDFLQLSIKIRDMNWSPVYCEQNINLATNEFYSILYKVFEETTQKVKTISNKYPCWFTKEIKDAIKQKRILSKQRHFSERLNAEFTDVRKRLKKLIKRANLEYINKVELEINHNPRGFWTYIKKSVGSTQESGFDMKFNSQSIVENETAEIFANYFYSVYSDKISTFNVDYEEVIGPSTESLVIKEITEKDYQKAIGKLKPKTSAGVDTIPPYIIKGCAEWLKGPLLYLYNLILKSSCFPDIWKQAIVTPVLKSGNKMEIENYRPISVLCAPVKILEHILYDKLWYHVQPLISENQHGFVPKKSTTTNSLIFNNDILQMINNKQQVDVLYTDFQKAFDKVDHDIILKKLHSLGVSESLLLLFVSYLQDRFFVVRHNGNTSGKFKANSGVPQGSNLGPLLFLIFINDLPDVLQYAKCLLFADDAKFYLPITTQIDSQNLQSDIDNIYNWSVNNNLKLNISKCHIMSFTKKSHICSYEYKINNNIVERVHIIKDLGVIYDSRMNYKLHINKIVRDAHRMLGFVLRQTQPFRNVNTVRNLYCSLVRPKLEYASLVWGDQPHSHLYEIEKVQNKLLRYLYFKKYQRYPSYETVRTKDLQNEFNLNSLDCRAVGKYIQLCSVINFGIIS